MRTLAPFQNAVQNSVFVAFDVNGNYIADILVVPGLVSNTAAGMHWIVGTSNFQTVSGLTPDFIMPAGILPTTGGMMCYGGGGGIVPQNPPNWSRTDFSTYVDCVAYGTYAGTANVKTGTPTTLDGDGHSLQRIGNTGNNLADFTCGDPAMPENSGATMPMTASLAATTPCPGCPPTPDSGCLDTFGKGTLLIKDATGKEKLLIKMTGGPALAQTDFGDPLSTGGTAYNACIYNDANTLVGSLTVDRAGATCGSDPCWKAIGGMPPGGKGYKYKDDTLSASGVAKIIYKSGAAGTSKLLVKGSGSNLPHNVAVGLQSTANATVQVRSSDAHCLSLTVTDIKKHDTNFFKAKK